MDPLKPSLSLLVKLGSVAVHVAEFISPRGHPYDLEAAKPLLVDPEVAEWVAQMTELAFLPVRRQAAPEEGSDE